MKKLIGYLKNLTGTFFAKDAEGNFREIYLGGELYSGEVIVDENGNRIFDALRKATEEIVDQMNETSTIDTNLKKFKKDEASPSKKSTTSTDSFEQSYEVVDINAKLLDPQIFVNRDTSEDERAFENQLRGRALDPVTDANESPDAQNEDTTQTGTVLENTTDTNGLDLSVIAFSVNGAVGTLGSPLAIADVGTIQIDADGDYTFVPVANYNGAVPAISYTVSNGETTDDSTLTLSITAVTDPITDGNESVSTDEDTDITEGDLFANLADADSTSHSITGATVDLNGSGTQTALVLGTATLIEDASGNDIGTITVNTDGTYDFSPAANYHGTVPQITYSLVDDNDAADTDAATLDISVTAVTDPITDGNESVNTGCIVDFDGSNSGDGNNKGDHITLGDSLNNVFGTSSNTFTVTAIINPDNLSDTTATNHHVQNVFMAKASDNKNDNFELGIHSDGSLLLYIDTLGRDQAAVAMTGTSGSIIVGEDNFIAVTYNDGVVTAYINGTEYTDSTTWTTGNTYLDQAAGSPFTIGGSLHIDNYFDGQMRNVTVHSTALSSLEVETVQDGGTVAAGLEASFDFTSDTPLDDLSGNGLDGSFVGDARLKDEGITNGNLFANLTDPDSASHSITEATVDTDGSGTQTTLMLGVATAITDVNDDEIGTITVNENGTYDFVRADGYYGAVPTITYSIVDDNDAADTDTSTLDIMEKEVQCILDFDGDEVAHWDFKGNTNDTAVSGSVADNGTLRNGASIIGNDVLVLDGVNDYVSISNSNDINLGTHVSRTIVFDFKADATGTGTQIIYEEGATVNGLNIYLNNSGEVVVGGWNNSTGWGGEWLTNSGTDLRDGNWHQVSLVLDATTNNAITGSITGYLDGNSFATAAASGLSAHSGDIRIGSSGNTLINNSSFTGGYFKGEIDGAIIYNTALDATQIDALYTERATLVDGIVEGIYYETSSELRGYTEADGGFNYLEGDSVTFSIGGIVIGEITMDSGAGEMVFLQDIAEVERTDVNDEYVENMAVLLQSLDNNSDAYDGIVITEEMHNTFAYENFDLATISEEALIGKIEDARLTAVTEDAAMTHVQDMLEEYAGIDEEAFDERISDKTAHDNVFVLEEGGIDFSKIELDHAYEKIDLTANGNHTILHLTLADVLNITDGEKLLHIETDEGDTVELNNNGEDIWKQIEGTNSYESSDGVQVVVEGEGKVNIESQKSTSAGNDPTVEVTVDDDITPII